MGCVPVLQVTYADHYGRFPWEEGYSMPELQPVPARSGPDEGAWTYSTGRPA